MAGQLFKGRLPSQFAKLKPCEFNGIIFGMSCNFISVRPSGSVILVSVELVPSGFLTVQIIAANQGAPLILFRSQEETLRVVTIAMKISL